MKEQNTPKINTVQLFKEALKKSYSYDDYRTLVAQHVASKTSTGPEQTDDLSQYTLLNDSRMRRLDKTTKIAENIKQDFLAFEKKQTWLVLTESWCGDAAQTMPVINKLARLAPHINLKVALRDENIALMNQFLTNGNMSIPKLIILDSTTDEIIGDWGPRPTEATKLVNDYKTKHGSLTPEFKEELQVWYNKNKGQNTAEDIHKLIS